MGLLNLLHRRVNGLVVPSSFDVVESARPWQDSFGYVLGIGDVVGRENFLRILGERGYQVGPKEIELLAPKDIIAYYISSREEKPFTNTGNFEGYCHAGIYLGEGQVIGKFGACGAVFQHDLEVMPEDYYDPEFGVQWISYRRSD